MSPIPPSRPGAGGPPRGPAPGGRPQAPAGPAPSAIARVDWSAQTQKLAERGEQSYRTKDGASYKGILDSHSTKNMQIGRITAGDHYWSIIPYLCGSQDPEVVAGRMKEGDPTYTVGVYPHKNIGPNNDRYICLARTYGLPCPICEYRNELARDPDADEEIVKSLRTSKYMSYVYYIWDRDNESKGVVIYEISGYFFERELQAQAKSARGGGYIPFMSPLAGPGGGRDIDFKVTMAGSNQDWTGVKFEERQQPIPDHILAQAIVPLDDLLHVPSYEELYEAFYGSGGAAEPQAEAATGTEEQHYECFQQGNCGGYADCQNCQDYQECAKGGMVQIQEPDIPSEPVHQPQPEPAPAPPAAPSRSPAAPARAVGPPPSPRPGAGPTPLRRGQK